MPMIEDQDLQLLTDSILEVKTALEKGGRRNDETLEKLGHAEKSIQQMRKDLDDVRRERLHARRDTGSLRPGQVVTDDCAEWLGCWFVAELEKKGALRNAENRPNIEKCLDHAVKVLGAQTRTTLSSSDIPLPVDYSGQVVELVWKYGQARQYGTVYPLPTGSVKLPKLSTSPAFGYISQAGNVTEKSPQAAFVTFNASKWGGIVRYPSEIDADSIIPLGQFLARYVAREMAKIEDVVFFTADGTGTYNSITGILGQEITLGNKVVCSTGNTSPDKITLANCRALRSQVGSAALPGAFYYMNMTMENLLSSFNTSATVTPYNSGNGLKGATLDGFPIRWVDVMPVYGTTATVSANQIGFGDLSYHYLGVRTGIQIDLSRDVYFATDEWGLRALERFTTGLMADKSNATLALAAS